MAYVREKEAVYPLLGRPQDSLEDELDHSYTVSWPTYFGVQYDATTTNLTYQIPAFASGYRPMNLTISFLSPITPTSTLRQSIPASYVSFIAEGDFDVDIYMDINGQWLSGDDGKKMWWAADGAPWEEGYNLQLLVAGLVEEQTFVEDHQQAEWGELYLGTLNPFNLCFNSSRNLRNHFAQQGELPRLDFNYRPIGDDEPALAYHQVLKLSKGATTPAVEVFTIAHVQDELVQFAAGRGLTRMRPFWKNWFSTIREMLTFHYADYYTAKALSEEYSARLANDAFEAGGSEYADIVALSARQVLGAVAFSGLRDDPMIFLKEISSNGNTQTVDVIFPAIPFFLYTNPTWLAYLLEPLLEHQLSGQYPNKWSMHDIGRHYPNLTGHRNGADEYMPVEECGNMLIMALALANSLKQETVKLAGPLWSKITGDGKTSVLDFSEPSSAESDTESIFGLDESFDDDEGRLNLAKSWVERAYNLWTQWTEYLIEYSLRPENQLSTDDFAGWLPLQTNLALKGIIGIKAMSELAGLVGREEEKKYYRNISDTYIRKWQDYGLSRNKEYAKLAYDWHGSWTTLYSLYANALLCFHDDTAFSSATSWLFPDQAASSADGAENSPFIPAAIYRNQSAWYSNVLQKYGLPLDSRHLYAKTDWMMEAAAVASPDVQAKLIRRLARWVDENEVRRPFTDIIMTEGKSFGGGIRFMARPVVGGHFALLALERACGGKGAQVVREWFEESERGGGREDL